MKKAVVVWFALLLLLVGVALADAMVITNVAPTDASHDADGTFTWSVTSDYNMTSANLVLVYPSGSTKTTAMTVGATKKTATLAETDLPAAVYTWYVTTVNATGESTPGTSSVWTVTVDPKRKPITLPAAVAEEEQAVQAEQGMSQRTMIIIGVVGLVGLAYFQKWGPFKK